ncbi:MAG: pyruvoyl-dependent arginine decarboxylase [Candidatus Woesearchaeota archaeon]
MAKSVVIGLRIPRDYFVTNGIGESDITIHAGSYHLALKDAGIEMCNIMTYSSIMPSIAREVPKPALVHGAVMETIMAVAHGKKGQRATAGIVYGWLYDKKTGKKYGGLVCEHNGNYDEKEVEKRLRASINELYVNGFSNQYDLKDITILKRSLKVSKKHGTALVAICFVNHEVPLL